ncbi:MAG: hypothetical protein ABGY95_11395 [Rubritalea sp.]|uniref:hypothetical protein n=1 Tax=Rubritalea sp. TaxID=2109375 RepID=UPI003242DAC6
MKEIYQHPVLESFTQNDCEQVWHAFREKNPNWTWALTFFGLWVLWSMSWMIGAQYLHQKYVEGPFAAIGLHLILSLVIGVIGGVMIIGRVMLPKRMKEFHRYLDTKDENTLMVELGLQKWDTEQVSGGNG